MNKLSSRIKGAISSLFSSEEQKSIIVHNLAFYQGMSELKPFICTLPHGDELWHYVLTGEGQSELAQLNAFVDLDQILILVHAKHHARDFYKQLKRTSSFSGFIGQFELRASLKNALSQVADELLENNDISWAEEIAFKQAYLRVLDIFYYLCDEETLDDDFYQQLVIERTALLSNQEFFDRYSPDQYASSEVLPERLERRIDQALKQLNSSTNTIGLDDITHLDRVFDETRLAYDCSQWRAINMGSFVLASYLLCRDHKHKINDGYTKALSKFIEENFLAVLNKSIRDEQDNIDQLVNWLTHTANGDTPAHHLDTIKASLAAKTYDASDQSELGSTQPCYDLFNSISRFLTLLNACYWLHATKRFPLARAVLTLSIELAPQRTLSVLSKQYREGVFTQAFANKKQLKKFLKEMLQLGLPKSQVDAFEVSYARKYDTKRYLWLMIKYTVTQEQAKRAVLDRGLLSINGDERQLFYLDVHRAERKMPFILLPELPKILAEQLRICAADNCNSLAGAFDAQDVKFIEWIEEEPKRLPKPLINDPNMLVLSDMRHVIVIIEQADNYLLIADGTDMYRDIDDYQWPYIGELLLFKPHVDKDKIFHALNNLPSHEQRCGLTLQYAQQYLAQKMSFKQYQHKAGPFLDIEDYSWATQHYSNKCGHLVPFILSEIDHDRRNRLIKLFCIGDEEDNNSLLSEISRELFLEQRLIAREFDLCDRHNITLDDLTDEAYQQYEAFERQFLEQLTAMDEE